MYFEIFKEVIDKLFLKVIPKDKTPFSIIFNDDFLKEFRKKEEDIFTLDNGYFSILQVYTNEEIADNVKNYLLREDYIKILPQDHVTSRYQLTDKGVEVKSFGTIELYNQFIKDQRELQVKVLKSSIKTDESVRINNIMTSRLSFIALLISAASVTISAFDYFKNDESVSKIQLKIIEKKQLSSDSTLQKAENIQSSQ